VAGKQEAIRGARTPEELETSLEDALVIGNANTLAALFEEGATLATGGEQPVRGGEAIARAALATPFGIGAYVADSRRILLARNSALVITDRGINVMHRGGDGVWRYVIVVHAVEESN
jgi:hypothetical protein